MIHVVATNLDPHSSNLSNVFILGCTAYNKSLFLAI